MNRLTHISLFLSTYLAGVAIGSLWPDVLAVSVIVAGGALVLLMAIAFWSALRVRAARRRDNRRRRSNIIPLRGPRRPGGAA